MAAKQPPKNVKVLAILRLRFSEDIDLILDWRVLGYGKDEPWEKRSNTKQDAFNKEANARAEVFLAETFCPAVRSGLSQEIGCETNVYIDEKDKQTVIFAYPHLLHFTGLSGRHSVLERPLSGVNGHPFFS